MKKDVMIDAISAIDQTYIIEYVQYETRLEILKTKKKKRTRGLLICPACIALVVCMLLVSLPLSFIVLGSDSVQELLSPVVDSLLFPLDQQEGSTDDPDQPTPPKQNPLQLNWIEWKLTEKMFDALGAGTDDSAIDKLQSSFGDGPVGERMQDLGDFLERLYEYYLEHKEEIDSIIKDPDTDQTTAEPDEQKTEQPLEPGGICVVDEQGVQYQLNDRGDAFIVLGYSPDVPHTERLIIPASIEGVKVSRIGDYAFYQDTTLKEITLSEGIYEIGAYGLACETLEIVHLPESLFTIERNAFDGTAIRSIEIPAKVTHLPMHTFANSKQLESVVFKGDIASIGDSAFWLCDSLKTLSLPNSLIVLSKYAFDHSGIERIQYSGTQAEWKNLTSDCTFDHIDHLIVVVCSDGEINIP